MTSLWAGLPVVLLTTTGARSGQPRTVPLVALKDDDQLILIASNFGQSKYPAWYYNLRAHPEAEVTLQGKSSTYVAAEAGEGQCDRYWQQALTLYPGYAAYKARAGTRRIPIFVLTPTD